MNDEILEQLNLFHKHLTWKELPKAVRERTVECFANLCVAVLTETPSTKEQDHESSTD